MTQYWKLIIVLIITFIILNILMKMMNDIKIQRELKAIPKCRKSTIDNPMGNVLLGDKNLDEKLCPNQNINDNLTYNIYYNEEDLFKTKNNTRPFITMPSQTYPNDMEQFKKFLYNFDNPTCKLNSKNCMFNEDIRYHKSERN